MALGFVVEIEGEKNKCEAEEKKNDRGKRKEKIEVGGKANGGT